MKARKILFVDHATDIGGAERSLLLLLSRLGRHHWQPHLACAPQELALEAKKSRLPIHPVLLPRLRRSMRFPIDWISNARALARIVGNIGAEAVYANTVRATFYCALAAKLAQRPLIWHMRDFWLSEEPPSRLWLDRLGKRMLMASASLIIANSRAVAANLPPSQKVRVVHNGIDLLGYSETHVAGDFRSAHHLPPQASIVGMVGRLRPWKGQERFLRVAAQVLEARTNTLFMVVGGTPFETSDEYFAHLKEVARQLGIAERVRFTGHLQDVRPALAALDLFVHPGEPEPFGLVNIEAMAMGLPVVAFAHGALPEIVEQGKTGRLVAPGDETAMARAICDLLDGAELRTMMGKAARERVETNFSIERVVDDIDALLQDIVLEA